MTINPVLGREIRERFRTRRAPVFVTLWVLGTGLVGYLVYLIAQLTATSTFGLGQAVAAGYMGKFIFEGMTLLLMTGVVMIVPGLTALSIVGERERQTFNLLQVTLLGPFQIVAGKLWSSMSYFLLLLVSVAPVAALPLLFGGVALRDVAAALGMLVLTAIMLGSVSIWGSARARSSRGAVASAYVWSFFLAFLTFALMAGELLFIGDQPFPPRGREVVSIWANPYVGIVSAVESPLALDVVAQGGTPYFPVEMLLYRRQGFDNAFMGVDAFAGGDVFIDNGAVERQELPQRRPPVWMYTVGIYLVVTGISLWAATRRVRAPGGRTVRLRRTRATT